MGNRWGACCLPWLTLFLAAGPGCLAFHRYRPVAVLARDAETGKPIPGAEVQVSYPYTPPSRSPYNSSATTEADGVARVRAAPAGEAGIRIETTAQGYMSDSRTLAIAEVEELEPEPLFGAAESKQPAVVVELYADPRPRVELVVPNYYRGKIKVEVRARAEVPCQPGQRVFRFDVPADGVVRAVGPLLLGRVYAPDYQARFADGKPIPREPKENDVVGFWWANSGNDVQYFLIGTRTEYDMLRRAGAFQDEPDARPHRGIEQGGGAGRRGRH
jgi:hypothetical protein